jgi:hypothetical protein
MQEHLQIMPVVVKEETVMNRTPHNTHDLAYYLGLNAALSALIFICLILAGVI